jgi:transcriptional regulator with XRE-family HTH domain
MGLSFSNLLRELRKGNGLSRKQVAKQIGENHWTYANWEQGRSEPSRKSIIILAKFYKISVDYLICRP